MTHGPALDLVHRIYERLHGRPPDRRTAAGIRDVLEGNGVIERSPGWFLELLSAIANDAVFADRHICEDQIGDPPFHLADVIVGLAEEAEIPLYADGEYFVLAFEPLDLSVCFDRMGQQPGLEVRFMRWPKGSGPRFDRWPGEDPGKWPTP